MIYIAHHLSTLLGFVLALLLFSHVLLEKRSPSSTLAWILFIFFVPYLGIPFYLVFGGRKMARLMKAKDFLYEGEGDPRESASNHIAEKILAGSGVPPACRGNQVTLLETGEKAYASLIQLIEGAEQSLQVATFILGNDPVGHDILERLGKKAAEGVQVRLLLDAFGCFGFPRQRLARFREQGGELARFMPMLHFPFRGRSNLRNHRKMAIADRKYAILGGMNLAEEYMGPVPLASRWRDLSLRLEGPGVGAVDNVFQSDWEFAAKSSTSVSPSDDEVKRDTSSAGPITVQVAGSGPDSDGDPLYDAYLTEIFRSTKRIWIATPYFVPDDAITRGLELAARRGVDVRILVPRESNHRLADLARGSCLRQIEQAGGKIHLFNGGMMHAKATLIDDDCAVVASANLDMRSLFLNYEIAVFLYSGESVDQLSEWFISLGKESTVGCPKVARARELMEGMARLVSPLL